MKRIAESGVPKDVVDELEEEWFAMDELVKSYMALAKHSSYCRPKR